MESASQIIAFDFAEMPVIRDSNCLQSVLPNRGDRPGACEVGSVSAAESELRCFDKFARKRGHRQGEGPKLREGRLLADA
jgi:hypothetical protein